jgi:hypothetical protein
MSAIASRAASIAVEMVAHDAFSTQAWLNAHRPSPAVGSAAAPMWNPGPRTPTAATSKVGARPVRARDGTSSCMTSDDPEIVCVQNAPAPDGPFPT